MSGGSAIVSFKQKEARRAPLPRCFNKITSLAQLESRYLHCGGRTKRKRGLLAYIRPG
jgi:hypothetical protein